MRQSGSLSVARLQPSKLRTSGPCSQSKPPSPEWLCFAETSTMAPFTALLSLELQAPLGIQVSGLKGSLRKGEERGFLHPLFILCVSQDANQEGDAESSGPRI